MSKEKIAELEQQVIKAHAYIEHVKSLHRARLVETKKLREIVAAIEEHNAQVIGDGARLLYISERFRRAWKAYKS